MKTQRVYYDGEKGRGNHTRKQFMQIMNRHFQKQCSEYIKSLRCHSCRKLISHSTNAALKSMKYQIKYLKKHKKRWTKKVRERYNKSLYSRQFMKKYNSLCDKCKRCKTRSNKKCNFADYVRFSGAEIS